MARSQGGLGLGFSLVQQLVVLHGGEVSAFSKGIPGEGGDFVIRLPAAPAPAAGKSDDPLAGKHVLVVDDNRDAAETMAMLLDALGYAASMAHDGLAGSRRSRPVRLTWYCSTSACRASAGSRSRGEYAPRWRIRRR